MDQDLLALLDQLEALIAEAHRIPLTGRVVLDEDRLYEQIDRLRAGIPEAFHQAQRVTRERERIIQQARDESEAILNESRAYAEKLTSEAAIMQKAQEEADRIIEEARQISREIRLGAREYADEVLEKVEANIQKAHAVVREGRAQLGQHGTKSPATQETATGSERG